MAQVSYISALYGCVKDFLCAWYETAGEVIVEEDLDEGVIDCVVGAVDEAIKGSSAAYFSRLEGSSTYVMCDLSEEELDAYASLLDSMIDEYNLCEMV
jgi:hypothetical protein